MTWFRRKPKKGFDYAAIRIGNVYVLPPDEDDLREFRQRRRREVTRRGFIVAGVVVALGAIALPFLPGKKSRLDPKMLFELDPASADKKLLKDLCVAFYAHPNPEIRFQCARVMATLTKDAQVKQLLWFYIRSESEPRVKNAAIDSLIQHGDRNDIPAIVDHYHSDPSSRAAVDAAIEDFDYAELRGAIDGWMNR
jgi:hypothetical protein